MQFWRERIHRFSHGVQLYLQDETGIAVLLYVGRDGSVQVGSDTGDAILYSYWDTESDALYEWLLSALDS